MSILSLSMHTIGYEFGLKHGNTAMQGEKENQKEALDELRRGFENGLEEAIAMNLTPHDVFEDAPEDAEWGEDICVEDTEENVATPEMIAELEDLLGFDYDDYEAEKERQNRIVAKRGHKIPHMHAPDEEETPPDSVTTTQIVPYELPDPLQACGVDLSIGALAVTPLSVRMKGEKLILYVSVERLSGVDEENERHLVHNIILVYKENREFVYLTEDLYEAHFLDTIVLPDDSERHIYYCIREYSFDELL